MAIIHLFAQLNLIQWRLPDVLRQCWHVFWLFCKTLPYVDGLNIDLGLHILPDAGVAWFKVWRSSWPVCWDAISNPLNSKDFIQKFSYLTLRVWAGGPPCRKNKFLCSSGTSCRTVGNASCKNWKLKIPSIVKHASSGKPKPNAAVSWRRGAFSNICSLELHAVC